MTHVLVHPKDLFQKLCKCIDNKEYARFSQLLPGISTMAKRELKIWEQIQKPSGIKTVLGVIHEFRYMDKLLGHKNYAITKAIYEHEKNLMYQYLQCLIIATEDVCEQFIKFAKFADDIE